MSRNASNTLSAATAVSRSGMLPSIPPLSPSVTKLCHIVKRPDFEGYGFNLHSEKVKPGQYIGKVDANSPAKLAGLKEGDRIIEVNDVAIGSDTHKQVVQRIKAIAFEVRLLLIDVDGKGDVPVHDHADIKDNNKHHAAATLMPSSTSATEKVPITVNSNNNKNKSTTTEGYHSTVQEMPGASANISSISMTSTKRMSNASNQSQNGHTSSNSHNNNGDFRMDITDKSAVNTAAPQAIGTDIVIAPSLNINNNKKVDSSFSLIMQERNGTSQQQQQQQQAAMKPNNNMIIATPPPPPATIIVPTQQQQKQPQAFSTAFSTTASSSTSTTIAAANNNVTETLSAVSTTTSNINEKGSGNQFGSLMLPMTAAEMRAKLLTKKKYDPKNESDLKKKFEIIQKL